jgi:protein transport protein SEC61 subunit alpha
MYQTLTRDSIIYGYFEIAAKEGDLAGMKGMIMG